jgi:S1-C subfamily serine protease
MSAAVLLLLAFVPGEVETVESKEFPRAEQLKAITATVRVINPVKKTEGSGTLVGCTKALAYVLTAAHVVAGAEKVEVATFTEASHPNPSAVVRGVEVIAVSAEADLAVLRFAAGDGLPKPVKVCPVAGVPGPKPFSGLSAGCATGKPPSCLIEDVKGKRRLKRPGADGHVLAWEAGALAKGRSGGALLDRSGRLVGVASGLGDGKGYYTHVEEVHAFLKRNGLEWLYEE